MPSATASPSPNPRREFAFSEADFRFIADLVGEKTGIVLAEHKQDMVYSRIARRLRALKMKTFSEYCDFVSSSQGSEEIVDFVNALTTNLTHFFRESHHFDHLREEVLKPLIDAKQPRIRIWSAGCSSGMEPYSIAMTLFDAGYHKAVNDSKILATDIDTNMVAFAAKGQYRSEHVNDVPEHLRKKFSKPIKGKDETQMQAELQQLITFKPLNLLENWPFQGTFDAVFCRNVVIYFNKDTQRTLFARMAKLIKPGGHLYIGHSENLHGVSDQFQLVGRTIYQRKSA